MKIEPSAERVHRPELGRRGFLIGATAATAATVLASCSGDSEPETSPTTTAPVTVPVPTKVPDLAGDPFTLGVASGDPDGSSVVIWTRLAPEPLAEDGLGGMPDEPAEVIWEVSDDADFGVLRAAGLAEANPRHAHSVHVVVDGLTGGSTVHYRFRYGDWTSDTGRTAALPAESPSSFRLAVANCQMFENGWYAAYRHMVDDAPDLVVHLGDYIYEYPFQIVEGRSPVPLRYLQTEADFRLRYACYKADPDLRAAHAAAPFVTTWDDHEVANNYMGDDVPLAEDGPARKAIAYRAWWEHQPTRLDPPEEGRLDVHRALVVGDLFRLLLLDERQHSDIPPCRTGEPGEFALDEGDCEARTAEDRSKLGVEQEDWVAEQLAGDPVTWNVIGNPVVLSGVDAGTDEASYYLDTWDGFPDARRRLIDQLAAVDNPVVLTGDYHAGMTLGLHREPFDVDSDLIAPEFMSPPISSVLFPADVSARTPHLREQINAHGYLVVDITAEELAVSFRCLDDVADPDSGIETRSAWTVTAGDPEPRRA